ncbi:peptidoglycan-associated lipoprotein Pal [Prosthecochloris sp. HL-130-GSB]|uniref:Peptidoglycan-associated lipoprotein n=1 Tax=Prosthecochloris aestuarii TaxID=1102 RepID=A0A831SP16_PROAE|nr:peptidoglycan-associated lipoprotein Pal [Prosthecochloris sp. HL-130-GSB]ARM31197.1 peptidoglycan-associated lipoprotein [Prosthecochloris sp. HL-130-GSB]MBO8092527.1 peptidoglycan-associated lipoprotein Pal [Prosthecochloris sp.]HED30299.1 peptidoglycan-associated lipoprotein Pal [Prosthecochloris aestuarii]
MKSLKQFLRMLLVPSALFFIGCGCCEEAVQPEIAPAPPAVAPAPVAVAQLADVFYAFDSSVLDMASQNQLKENAQWMMDNPDSKVIIEGHCDERGTNEYNIALGERRADSAKNYLVNLGIDPSRMQTVSYGEERPFDPGHDEAAWAKNRRAHFVVQ